MCILCYLIPILVGLISALLGYLLGRLLSRNTEKMKILKADLDACRAKSKELQLELDKLNIEYSDLKSGFSAPIPLFDANLAESVFGAVIVENDLKIIEGIGPGIEKLFHAEGIKTWKGLSELTSEQCREILDKGGRAFQMHNPSTWPRQSELAYQGKWHELKEYQDFLLGGRQ